MSVKTKHSGNIYEKWSKRTKIARTADKTVAPDKSLGLKNKQIE